MNSKIRILILVSALVLAVFVFCSCNKNDGNGTDTTTAATGENTTTGAPESPYIDPENFIIKVNDDGKVNFSIVRPDDDDTASQSVRTCQRIQTEIETLLGATPLLTTDYIYRGTERDPYACEIIVGLTNYDEAATVSAECGYGDYMIKIVNNKIVVFSYTDTGLSDAMSDMLRILRGGYDKDSNTIVLKASGVETKKSCSEQLSALPIYDGGKFSASYDAGLRTTNVEADEVIITETTPEEYNAYLTELKNSGFTEYTTHEMNNNLFATYTNSKYTINAGYYAYETSARIIIEPLAPAVGLQSENTYTKVTTSQITMLGLEYTTSAGEKKSNGLSVLIRLEDGRFIVIDGGFNNAGSENTLISNMKSQASAYTTKPVVAAWIITHSHGDHSGVLGNRYNSLISNNITVQRVLANFISDSEITRNSVTSGVGETFVNATTWHAAVITAANALNATLYKIHVGQVFHFADLQMEIMFTLESFAPKVCNAYNTTSNVIKMTFTNDGKKTVYMSTGDATGNGMQICTKMYSNYMQSDIVQVCHHGYSTWGNDSGTASGYKVINAPLVLWPQGLAGYPNYKGKSYNAVLFTVSNYKEVFVAGAVGDVITVKLPYVYGNNCVTETRAN